MTRLTIYEDRALDVLPTLRADWDRLAQAASTPYATTAWLESWCAAYAPDARCVVAEGDDGTLLAAACVLRRRPGSIRAAANGHTCTWAVLGSDVRAVTAVWRQLAALAPRLALGPVPAAPPGLAVGRRVLRDAGYRVSERSTLSCPRLALPASWEELEAGLSRNLRAQYRRRERALERAGHLSFRTAAPVEAAEAFDAFLQLEARGWKGREGSALLMDPPGLQTYTRFVARAAEEGWLRLQLLELDGALVAADVGCVVDGGAFMLKTAYDEVLQSQSPGLVLRGAALRSAVEDRLAFYDFLGAAESYKTRWGCDLQEHVALKAFRGSTAPVLHTYESTVRPRLGASRRRVRAAVAQARSAAGGPGPSPGRRSLEAGPLAEERLVEAQLDG